jgi:transcriptional regulator with XRE-family HTH domain
MCLSKKMADEGRIPADLGSALGLCMRELRAERRMTQGDIVRATGLERSYVSNIEAGKIKHPRIETVDKIAKAFGMKLSEFVVFCERQHPDFPAFSREGK